MICAVPKDRAMTPPGPLAQAFPGVPGMIVTADLCPPFGGGRGRGCSSQGGTPARFKGPPPARPLWPSLSDVGGDPGPGLGWPGPDPIAV
jgi:hypothetical protein